MDIYVVTPSFNSEETINRTIHSVISQAGNFTINYHIQDGGSTDKTKEILKQWQTLLEKNSIPINCNNIKFSYSSERDQGMYDAIQKGFSSLQFRENEWITWINSDDIILPDTFSLITNITNSNLNVNWITGQPMISTGGSQVRCNDRMLNSEIIKLGLADGISAPFIQQEGTFFKGFLWRKHNVKALKNFKYAGDWSLWKHFAQEEEIYYSDYATGVFTSRPDQISKKFWDLYVLEIIKNNDYSQNIGNSDRYFRIVPRLHDGQITIEKRQTNVKINGDDENEPCKNLYEKIEHCIRKKEIKLVKKYKRVFIFGYNGFSKNIYEKLKSGAETLFLVSDTKFTNKNQGNIFTIDEANVSEDDLIIVTSFKDSTISKLLKDRNIISKIMHWTEILSEDVIL